MKLFSAILWFCLTLSLSASNPSGSWFVFAPSNTSDPGKVGLADWLHRPAGKHGYVQMKGDRLVFADGTPIKFWGTNHGNKGVAPTPEEASRRAAWYAKMGINAVRFHKFTWPINGRHGNGLGDPNDSTRLDPATLDRMDSYHAKLREQGIYVTWSHIFGHRPMPGDRERLVAYDEIVTGPPENFLGNSTYGVVNLFEDMQALNIALTLNLLNHRNLYTGLRYADDPSRAQNSGQTYNADRTVLETVGEAPILLEGVDFTLAWPRLTGAGVRVLDHDGLPTDRVTQTGKGSLRFNTALDRAIYYEIFWP